ncbi:uncharacterized protein V1516DRAFT_662445 [Lipomyces oligophaga]|uniref:uncharacterized protein n=1 Tax=Lipomyces oligophaga TaxID=45792 RepID=UPI0034CD0A1E
MSDPARGGPPAQVVWKKMGWFAIGALGLFIGTKTILNERRRKNYQQQKIADREPGHQYQKIAEVETHTDGASAPSSEESNDPSFGRGRHT